MKLNATCLTHLARFNLSFLVPSEETKRNQNAGPERNAFTTGDVPKRMTIIKSKTFAAETTENVRDDARATESPRYNLELPEDTPQPVPKWATLEARANRARETGACSVNGLEGFDPKTAGALQAEALERTTVRFAAKPLREAFESARTSGKRSLIVLAGPRACGITEIATNLENRGPLIDLGQPRICREAEADPLAFLSRYGVVSSVVLLSAHLAPNLLALLSTLAGTSTETSFGTAKIPSVYVLTMEALSAELLAAAMGNAPFTASTTGTSDTDCQGFGCH